MPLSRRRSLEQPEHPPYSSRSRPVSPLHNGATPPQPQPQLRSHFYGLSSTPNPSYSSTPTMNRTQTLPESGQDRPAVTRPSSPIQQNGQAVQHSKDKKRNLFGQFKKKHRAELPTSIDSSDMKSPSTTNINTALTNATTTIMSPTATTISSRHKTKLSNDYNLSSIRPTPHPLNSAQMISNRPKVYTPIMEIDMALLLTENNENRLALQH
ncbi:unnamed protein product [Absidia cylindrospora]